MDSAVISCGNTCVVSLWMWILITGWHLNIDQYISLMISWLVWCLLYFLGTIHPLLLYNTVLMKLWLILWAVYIFVMWIYLPCSGHIITMPILTLFTYLDNKSAFKLYNIFAYTCMSCHGCEIILCNYYFYQGIRNYPSYIFFGFLFIWWLPIEIGFFSLITAALYYIPNNILRYSYQFL